MSYADFVTHLGVVLDQLGMTLYARTNFIKYVACYLFDSCVFLLNNVDLTPATTFPRLHNTKTSHIGSCRRGRLPLR